MPGIELDESFILHAVNSIIKLVLANNVVTLLIFLPQIL